MHKSKRIAIKKAEVEAQPSRHARIKARPALHHCRRSPLHRRSPRRQYGKERRKQTAKAFNKAVEYCTFKGMVKYTSPSSTSTSLQPKMGQIAGYSYKTTLLMKNSGSDPRMDG